MITVKHTNIKVNKEYNIYEETDKSVTIVCASNDEKLNITKEALNQFIIVLQNIERSQDYYDW